MERGPRALAGFGVFAGFFVGIVAFLAGTLAVFNDYDYIGEGHCFLASANALGMLANAIFRE